MKIRNGFVSNSSSSSFIIAVKNATLKQKVAEYSKELRSKLGKKFPFADFIDEIFDYIINNSSEFDVSQEVYDGYDEDNYWEEHPEMEKLHKKGYKLYEIRACSDDEEPVGLYLYNKVDEIDFENQDKTLIALQME